MEKELRNVELDWFAKSPEGSTEIASVGLAPQSNIPASGANAIILVSDLPDMCAASQLSKGITQYGHGLPRLCTQLERNVHAVPKQKAIKRYNAGQQPGTALSPTLLTRFQKAAVKLFWATPGQTF